MYIYVYCIPHFIVPYKSQLKTSVKYIHTNNLSVTFYLTLNIFQSLSKDQLIQATTCLTLIKIPHITVFDLHIHVHMYKK